MSLIAPCSNCPWKAEYKDDNDYLRPGRRAEIMRALLDGGTFPCHQTTTHSDDDDGHQVVTGAEKDCPGADLVLLRGGHMPQMLRIRSRIGMVDPDVLEKHNEDVALWTLREALDELQGDDDEGECCTVVGVNCLHPAGWLVGGEAVHNDDFCETICPKCGSPVCDECMESPDHECNQQQGEY